MKDVEICLLSADKILTSIRSQLNDAELAKEGEALHAALKSAWAAAEADLHLIASSSAALSSDSRSEVTAHTTPTVQYGFHSGSHPSSASSSLSLSGKRRTKNWAFCQWPSQFSPDSLRLSCGLPCWFDEGEAAAFWAMQGSNIAAVCKFCSEAAAHICSSEALSEATKLFEASKQNRRPYNMNAQSFSSVVVLLYWIWYLGYERRTGDTIRQTASATMFNDNPLIQQWFCSKISAAPIHNWLRSCSREPGTLLLLQEAEPSLRQLLTKKKPRVS